MQSSIFLDHFLRWKQVGGKLYESVESDSTLKYISTSQIIAMTFATFWVVSNIDLSLNVGRWIVMQKKVLVESCFHAATSNLVYEKEFDSFEFVIGILNC